MSASNGVLELFDNNWSIRFLFDCTKTEVLAIFFVLLSNEVLELILLFNRLNFLKM